MTIAFLSGVSYLLCIITLFFGFNTAMTMYGIIYAFQNMNENGFIVLLNVLTNYFCGFTYTLIFNVMALCYLVYYNFDEIKCHYNMIKKMNEIDNTNNINNIEINNIDNIEINKLIFKKMIKIVDNGITYIDHINNLKKYYNDYYENNNFKILISNNIDCIFNISYSIPFIKKIVIKYKQLLERYNSENQDQISNKIQINSPEQEMMAQQMVQMMKMFENVGNIQKPNNVNLKIKLDPKSKAKSKQK